MHLIDVLSISPKETTCDSLFAILHTKPLKRSGLLSEDGICFQMEQNLPFYKRLFSTKGTKTIFKELPPLNVYPFAVR